MFTAFSEAAERNKGPILEVLKEYIPLNEKARFLEIGSGTGQHAIFFAENFKNCEWVSTDQPSYHKDLKAVFKKAKIKNLSGPFALTVGKDDFPSKKPFNYVYSSNTLHIMSWKHCKTLFKLLGKRLRTGSLVFFYGPFNYNGEFSSRSNEDFDKFLKGRSSQSGIRHFEDVLQAMKKSNFKLLSDHKMPANNRILVFEKQEHK